MITRLVQSGIVVLWLTMTVWLVRTTWFPDESRFETVETREVMNAMFENWNERAELVLLENGSEVGRMSVSASNARDDKADDENHGDGPRHRLSSEGSLSEFGVLEFTERGRDELDRLSGIDARRDKFIWRTVVSLDESFAFAAFEAVLRFPEQSAKLELNYVKASDQIAVRAIFNGMPAVQFEGKLSDLQSSIPGGGRMGLGMGMGFPIPLPSPAPGDLSERGADDTTGTAAISSISQWLADLLSDPSGEAAREKLEAMRPHLTAKFGRTKIAGESMAVYLLLATVGSQNGEGGNPPGAENAIRLYVGEDGRPVWIDTPFGFEAIAEVMVPDAESKNDGNRAPRVISRLP